MFFTKDVYGTQELKPTTYEFDIDTVYIRSNIREEIKTNEDKQESIKFWVYDETQCNFNEFIELLNSKVDKSNSEQENLILDNAYRVAVLELNNQSAL